MNPEQNSLYVVWFMLFCGTVTYRPPNMRHLDDDDVPIWSPLLYSMVENTLR